MKSPLRFATALFVVAAFFAAQGFATPHMLGMDCDADCPDCAVECIGCQVASAEPPQPLDTAGDQTGPKEVAQVGAAFTASAPRRPGAPPRGPPA